MKPKPVDTPIFSTWDRKNLENFATEAYLKMQAQHELIQYLRMLVASTPRNSDAEKIDPPLA